MSLRTRLLRIAIGLLILAGLLSALFAITLPAMHRWGATAAEVSQTLPGDALLTKPLIRWTHGETINAPPAQVWPWIAQLGDTRAGYYSYTFIENRVGAITGGTDYNVVYHNADSVHPEWQNPRPGDPMIQSVLKVREVQPGEYLLADAVHPEAFNWVWLWHLQPVDGGQHTRLVVHFGIQLPGADSNPVMTFMMDVGGFVMEQNMLQGIKTRAEGGSEPTWTEPAEIALWLAALLAGLAAGVMFVFMPGRPRPLAALLAGSAAGVLFLFRPGWPRPLAVAVAAVVALFVLTFVQPALWVRLLIDLGLFAGLAWAWTWRAQPAGEARPSPAARQLPS
jgi:hypothetical protein